MHARSLCIAVATLVAWRQLEGSRRVVMPLVALGVGLAGLATASLAARLAADETTTVAEEAGIVDQQGAVLELLEDDDLAPTPSASTSNASTSGAAAE